MRTACSDEQGENRLTHDGFVVVALLGPDELTELRQRVARLGFGKDDATGFPVPRSRTRISLTQGDSETTDRIFSDLSPMLQTAVNRILREYVLLRISIFDKLPRGQGIGAHQHATIVDESRYRSLAIWLPLTDTTVEMGTLHVVKGSHKFTNGFRPKNRVPRRFARVSRRVMAHYSTPMLLQAGEAVVFDDRVIHWSPRNQSSRMRTALQLELIPEEAELVMYYRTSGAELTKYAIERSMYRRDWLNREDPSKLPQLEKLSQPDVTYDDRRFISMARGTRFDGAPPPEPFFSRVFFRIRERVRAIVRRGA